jgi:hypothetical protein
MLNSFSPRFCSRGRKLYEVSDLDPTSQNVPLPQSDRGKERRISEDLRQTEWELEKSPHNLEQLRGTGW